MTLRAAPKPQKPVRGTAEARAYMADVARLSCVCCSADSEQLHHPIHGRYSQRRASDMDVIPMCHHHHFMLHNRPEAWQEAYGQDSEYVEPTRKAVDQLRASTIGGR